MDGEGDHRRKAGLPHDVERAARIGLLTSVVPTDRLDAEVDRYAGMLAKGAPHALAATKALLHRPRSADIGADFDEVLELSARHFASAEGQEGMRAFAEKRQAQWKAR